MRSHPYVRAFMAGIFVPTLLLFVGLSVFIVVRLVLAVPVPIERVIVFPMAVVPNAWGAWNMLYVRLHGGRYASVGLHGALLPFVLAPTGVLVASSFGVLSFGPGAFELPGGVQLSYAVVAAVFCLALAIYYLVWKYAVGSLNAMLGIA